MFSEYNWAGLLLPFTYLQQLAERCAHSLATATQPDQGDPDEKDTDRRRRFSCLAGRM